jgi:glutathione S-transferase
MQREIAVATASMSTLIRLMAGNYRTPIGGRPEKPLEIYEFESCPFCRKVREALSMLDLDVVVHPCPKGGRRYRPWVKEHGGKAQFPFLVDPNTQSEMYESDDIVQYLFERYGDGHVPALLDLGPLTLASSALAGLPRMNAGGRARPSSTPEQPLELYGMEASPFCRLVREVLCELEIPYLLHNVPKGGEERREAFRKRAGKLMVPWLSDPNTGKEMFESADIIDYLEATYGAPAGATGA